MTVQHGNAGLDMDHKGWLIGRFRTGDLHNTDVEVKYGIHSPGERRSHAERTAQKTATTLAILISGDMSIITEDASGEPSEVRMQTQGDYVMWGPGIMHWYAVRKNTIVVTIRWPSAPDDTLQP